MRTGFFTQSNVNHVATLTNPEDGKNYLSTIIDQHITNHPGTKPENVSKIRQAIQKARTIRDLTFTVQNFVLAHPSEGLKVL